MKPLKQLCQPRQKVFDKSKRDTVLNLSDLIQDRIEPDEFFKENYMTDGMKRLLVEAFRRFAGKSDQSVFKLTQAMGGGKTHNMIALGLLAKHPDIRKGVLNELEQMGKVGEVRVVGFNGRETDAPLGVWGSIAEQLGKKELFKDYYSPLSAPGQMEALFNKSAELKAINLIIAEMAVRYALNENPVTDYSQRVDFDFFQLPSVE